MPYEDYFKENVEKGHNEERLFKSLLKSIEERYPIFLYTWNCWIYNEGEIETDTISVNSFDIKGKENSEDGFAVFNIQSKQTNKIFFKVYPFTFGIVPIKHAAFPFSSLNLCGFNFFVADTGGETYFFLWTFSEFYILAGKYYSVSLNEPTFKYLPKLIENLVNHGILPAIFREYEKW